MPLRQSLKIWYADGNFILRADDTIFRIYRGALTSKSTVFRTICATRHDSPASEEDRDGLIEGCPILVLTDRAQDMEYFLCAIFDPEFVVNEYGVGTSMVAVVAILRMSSKYGVPFLQRDCFALLNSAFPDTLRDWDRLTRSRSLADYILVIEAVREMGLKWLLPAAYYLVLMQVITVAPTPDDPIICQVDRDCMDRMPVPDRAYVTLGAINVFHGSHYILDGMRSALFKQCSGRERCGTNRISAFEELVEAVAAEPLSFLVGSAFWVAVQRELCASCGIALREAWQHKRSQLWEALPQMFGLEPWNTLLISRANYAVGLAIAGEDVA
ncbi:hypothetical protein B0H11DRAFT_1712643 [Mycena galericulata]|nr:hypothetical protein B0H11DRAFT_1712643 [Mycena galericulata]